jgi:hypothetical protein
MVQIGNEINNGMSGETDVANIRKLLTAGSKAVREAAVNSGKEILVAVHYTNIDDMKKLDTLLTGLQVKEIDYDIVGLSFYPNWHGTMDDLKNAIIHVRDTYGKKVYVAENAYCYTSEDGDGSANSIKGTDDLAEGYSASVQGQANEVRDVCAAASEATTKEEACKVLLSLCESVGRRLRASHQLAGQICTEIRYSDFRNVSHQMPIDIPTASVNLLYEDACALFDELWDSTPIRLLGIRTSKLVPEDEPVQLSLFDFPAPRSEKQQKLDAALDNIRAKYGKDAIKRGRFL